MMAFSHSELLFQRAQARIPGGVNSPVRAFGSVGGTPRMIVKANGAYLVDADGNQYLDYVGSWGPMLLGHNHAAIKEAVIHAVENGLSFGAATELEVTMAELLCSLVPSLDMVRMVNSGTEAVMSAIRLARGYTQKEKIIKFEGCYHGHCDSMLVKAGSGVMTAGVPDSAGVPKGCAEDTLTAVYQDLASVERLFAENEGKIAAVILEPVAANMGVVVPEASFLQKLRELCTKHQTVLIFDEVNTLRGMGYSTQAAKQALHQARGNLDDALKVLLSNPHMWWLQDADPENNSRQASPSQESINQLVYMGFDTVVAEAALRVFGGNVQLAAQTLAHHGGSLPPDLQFSGEDSSPTPSTSPSDSAGTSSASTDEDMETEAVNEILEDIPEHEEDYLDSTLEDEEVIIAEYLSYVESISSAAKNN